MNAQEFEKLITLLDHDDLVKLSVQMFTALIHCKEVGLRMLDKIFGTSSQKSHNPLKIDETKIEEQPESSSDKMDSSPRNPQKEEETEASESVEDPGNHSPGKKPHETMTVCLECTDIYHNPEETNCPICGSPLSSYDHDFVEVIHIDPINIRVEKHHYPEFFCPNRCKDENGKRQIYISSDPKEVCPLPRSKAGADLIAHIVTQRFLMSVPLDRQQMIYQATGLRLSKQTMCNWINDAADVVAPLVHEMFKDFRKSGVAHLDETTHQCLEVMQSGGNKKCSIIVGVTGEWEKKQMALYRFEKTKEQSFVDRFMGKDYLGAMMNDGNKAYENYQMDESLTGNKGKKVERDLKRAEYIESQITDPCRCVKLTCMFHAREQFFSHMKTRNDYKAYKKLDDEFKKAKGAEKIKKAHQKIVDYVGTQPALYLLLQIIWAIGRLYDIEDECKKYNLNPDQILAARQAGSSLIFKKLGEYVRRADAYFPESSPIGNACDYFLARESILSRFLLDGHYPLDNDRCEQMVRIITIGRKNSLFFNSVRGAKSACIWYSLVQSARLNNLNVEAYIYYAMEKIKADPDQCLTSDFLQPLLPYSESLPDDVKLKVKIKEKQITSRYTK